MVQRRAIRRAQQDNLLDYDQVEALAKEHQPKMIIAGGSAIPRQIDLQTHARDCRQVGAYLHVDMAHFAGLVAAGEHPSPFPHAHVATTTTHKTLRGPRGGMILTNDEAMAKKVQLGHLPRHSGRPADARDRGQGRGLWRSAAPEFKTYIQQVVKNAQALADQLIKGGLDTSPTAPTPMLCWSICAPKASQATSPTRPWAARTSPATKTASRLTLKSRP